MTSNQSIGFLRRAIEQADLRVLLMVLFQGTGDRRWLNPPFTPARDVNLIADEAAGLPPEVQQSIRAAALDWLVDDEAPAIAAPDDDLMLEMMRCCLGEKVAPEYAPMMREQLCFAPVANEPAGTSATIRPVVIVGAGISGMAIGVRLKQQGIPFLILERNEQVGGTWWENRYPGCAVDTPNHAYSFSYGARFDWSRFFSKRDELQAYMQRCASEFGLLADIRLRHEMLSAQWQSLKTGGDYWQVQLRDSQGQMQEIEASALVSAIGQLSLPKIPKLPGASSFAGPMFHSAHWPDDLDLTGKRVAIIGTGASCMQIAPAIAEQVKSLHIFQRTAQWVRHIPRFHEEIAPGVRWLLKNVPLYAAWTRFTMFWRYGDGLLRTLQIDPEWPHPDRSLNRVNDRHRQQMTEYITRQLSGRDDLLQQCLPEYPPYGKRILLDNHWYRTLCRDNVTLISTPVSHIEPDAICDVAGHRRQVDVIVMATGFQVGLMAARLNITGRAGIELSKQWAGDNPSAYLGITVPNFPNLFCMQGPGTGLGHGGSTIFQAECQAHYIARCIRQYLSVDNRMLEVKQQVHDEYNKQFDAAHQRMVWSHPGMSTYYRNKAGRVYSVMPWRLVDYWKMTREPDPTAFETS
jgi:4-hydroxyacetophenone monooxygenase